MRSLEQLAVTATAQSLLAARDVTHLLQLRAWRSARGALPHALRARILDVLSYAFDLELRGGCGRVRANELAFWMEALSQLVETAPWNLTSAGALPLAFRAEQHSPLNVRVLRNLSPAALVSLSVEGAAVCDELLSAVAALPALTSATLVCPRRTKPCVSDAGVSALADSRSLRVLSLTGSAVTDDGVSALRRLTTLVCLDLSGSSQLSAASIQSLGRSSAGRDMPPQAREAAGGQPQLACVLMLDMERAGSSAVAGSVSALPRGAILYWSRRSVQVSGAAPHADACACFLVRRDASEDENPPHPVQTERASAHAAFATAADSARRVCPSIELCVRATLGKGITHVSVNEVESEQHAETRGTSRCTDACSTEAVQSRRSVARMLRLLGAPVQAQDARTAAGKSLICAEGRGAHADTDVHEDATRVTEGGLASMMPRKMTPSNRLAGRFGVLSALARVGPPHKKTRTDSGAL